MSRLVCDMYVRDTSKCAHGFMGSNADQGAIILYTFSPFINVSTALGTRLLRLKHFQG